MPAGSFSRTNSIYYTEQSYSQSKFTEFKQAVEYEQFKTEYISAIDATIEFYLEHGTDNDYKKSVQTGLNKFKEKLFSPGTDSQYLHTLFQAKKDMEQIAQSLKPAEGGVVLLPREWAPFLNFRQFCSFEACQTR